MNFKTSIQRAGIRAAFAASILIILLASCQREAVTKPETISQEKLSAASLNSLAATATAKSIYKVSAPISLRNAHDITISGDSINGGNSSCISLSNCQNIHITRCKLINSKTCGITLSGCTGILIDSSFVGNVASGVYAVNSTGIQVKGTQMRNMVGPYPKGQFVQFDNVSGAGNRVCNNKFENIMGASSPEDAISMYKSNGTAADPISIVGNWIRGGGPSKTGGGIMLGDNGGSYITAMYNTLVDPGQYGMAVSGGTNMKIMNNLVYGRAQSFTNVGIYYWNQSGLPSSSITISGNKVNFTSGSYGVNNDFIGASNTTPTGWSTNVWSANINSSILPSKIITL